MGKKKLLKSTSKTTPELKVFQVEDVEVVFADGADATEEEARAYYDHVQGLPFSADITKVTVKRTEHWADMDYTLEKRPFERIRRITGYLTSTADKWNQAKQAELKDRVKHEAEGCKA